MKCDELKLAENNTAFGNYYYHAEDVDSAIAELKRENRRMKRALWMARAERAMAESYSVLNDVQTANRWVKALNKLKTKAKEYK